MDDWYQQIMQADLRSSYISKAYNEIVDAMRGGSTFESAFSAWADVNAELCKEFYIDIDDVQQILDVYGIEGGV